MNKDITIFEQLIKPINKEAFNELAKKYQADKYIKDYTTWNHFITLLYAQFTKQESLRTLVMNFNQFISEKKIKDLKSVNRSTVSDANKNRPEGFYRELFYRLLPLLNRQTKNEFKEAVSIIDSTPIVLSGRGMDWADSNARIQGLKMHILYIPELECPVHFTFTSPRINDIEEAKKIKIERKRIYIFDRAYYDFKWWHEFTEVGSTFVTRPKSTLRYKLVEPKEVSEDEIKFDHVIKLCSKKGSKYKDFLRLVKVSVEMGGRFRTIKVITNNMTLSAGEIAKLYKKRWQIELFFKWIKQNLKIKKFFGENENAIKIQIIIGLIACLLTKLIQSHLKEALSMRNIIMFLRCNVGTFVQNWAILKPPKIIPQFTMAPRRIL